MSAGSAVLEERRTDIRTGKLLPDKKAEYADRKPLHQPMNEEHEENMLLLQIRDGNTVLFTLYEDGNVYIRDEKIKFDQVMGQFGILTRFFEDVVKSKAYDLKFRQKAQQDPIPVSPTDAVYPQSLDAELRRDK